MMTSTPPFLSIITVTKNNLNGLRNTAKSIHLQSNQNFEWIIIDGLSSDGTQEFLKNSDATITISESDNGIYHAMNKGLNKAKGTYILFLNAGDVLAEADTLETIQDNLSGEIDFIYGDALETDKNNNLFYKRSKPFTNITKGMFTHHQSMLYNREKIGSLQFDTKYRIAADYDFTLRFLKCIDKPRLIQYIPCPICIFESGGLSQQKTKLGRKEQFNIRSNQTPGLQNNWIYFKQWLVQIMRNRIPALYWYYKK